MDNFTNNNYKMKTLKLICFALIVPLFFSNHTYGQFGISTDLLKMGASTLGIDKMFKKPAAITTSFEDVNKVGSKMVQKKILLLLF